MQNEHALTTIQKIDPITEVKNELKKIIKSFPKRYGYAKKVTERLQKKGYQVEELNVFNVVNSRTYFDKTIALEIKALYNDFQDEIKNTLSELQTNTDHAGSTNNS